MAKKEGIVTQECEAIPFYPDVTVLDVLEPTSLVPPKFLPMPAEAGPHLNLLAIRRALLLVSRQFGFSPEELVEQNRTQPLVTVRKVAMFVAWTSAGGAGNFSATGRVFQRDHTTVISAVRDVQRMIEKDEKLRSVVELLVKEVLGA